MGKKKDNNHDSVGKQGLGKGKLKPGSKKGWMPKNLYETELFRLQAELVEMQEWVR